MQSKPISKNGKVGTQFSPRPLRVLNFPAENKVMQNTLVYCTCTLIAYVLSNYSIVTKKNNL